MITLNQARAAARAVSSSLLMSLTLLSAAGAQTAQATEKATEKAPANDATMELARKRACLACHQIDRPRAGPAFQDIARRYQGDKQAETRLVQKVLKGGGGVWKMPMGPMPAQSQVNEAEARQLVKWILAGR